ncbi:MAG TPA: tRNA (5-methylaminomethyl-2-thiouridine)(34)-methyltransferase MnmD, partial [Cyclobacteriaceae bacterium]|nr:tRNA (5-methylaminomethyl-2-thiouridine)(34)-methyltransferase MnmD [Cyclobacteriaceae bacterium]
MNGLKIIETEDGSHSLLNESLNETYHSTHGAIRESLHVFINNGLHFLLERNKLSHLSILEIGFGTGLNALLAFRESQDQKIKIHFTTVEAFPIAADFIAGLNYPDQLKFSPRHFVELHHADWNKTVSITPTFDIEKREGTVQELNFDDEIFDLVFFDAFAPNKQPEMWERPLLEKIFRSMKNDAVFVTYCA